MDPVRAKVNFENSWAAQQAAHRRLLRSTGVLWREFIKSQSTKGPIDNRQLEAAESIAKQYEQASDLNVGLQNVVQLEVDLSPAWRQRVRELSTELTSELQKWQQYKKQYQRYQGYQLSKQWFQLTLEQKREKLHSYYWLTDESPAWLLSHVPANLPPMVDKRTVQEADKARIDKLSMLEKAYQELSTDIQTLRKLCEEELRHSSDRSIPEKNAASRVIELLTAPYGQDMRGLMLLQAGPGASDKTRSTIENLMTRYEQQMDHIRPALLQAVDRMHVQIKPHTQSLIASRNFQQAFVNEVYLAEAAAWWRPMRIFASRNARLQVYEDVHLHEKKNGKYRVEFLSDSYMAWLEPGRVMLSPVPGKLPQRMAHIVPNDGHGQPVTKDTELPMNDLNANIQCHSPAGWQPVVVLDESPFGVVIRWQGIAEPFEILQPRSALRIVNGP